MGQRRNHYQKLEIRKYVEINKNENTIYKNTWDAAKPMVRGKFLTVNVQ